MYLMYVDESGDPGWPDPGKAASEQPSNHFALSGFIIPVEDWRNYLTIMVEIRREIKRQFAYPVRTELKGSELINPRGNKFFKKLTRKKRVQIYSSVLDAVALRFTRAKLINVFADKGNLRTTGISNTDDLELLAWNRLIQRFDIFLKRNGDSLGMIFPDEGKEEKIRKLLRKMRVHNYVPSHFGQPYNAPVTHVIEDPVMRDSVLSYFVQFADLVVHSLYRKKMPKGGYRRYNIDRLFNRVDRLLVKQASRSDPYGIVYL